MESRANPARETRVVPTATTQYDPTRDGAKSKKKKAPGACYSCQQMGHFANRCPEKQRSQGHSKKQQVSTKKTEIEEEDEDSVNSPELLQFHSLQVMANKKSSGRRQLDVKATNIKTLYATSPPMMTEVCLEKVCVAKFECDTAASHNVISAELCR